MVMIFFTHLDHIHYASLPVERITAHHDPRRSADGILALRYMFGLTGSSLIAGAVGSTATRTDAIAIKAFLDANRSTFDIDGDGNVDALTDGLLIVRYLFGLRGPSLIQGAFSATAPRNTSALIESYLATLTP